MKMLVKTSNSGPLNMRDKPSKSGGLLGTIPNGTEVDATTCASDTKWMVVAYKGNTGYCMADFLVPVSDKEKLRKVYESLKLTLSLIEEVLE